MKVVQILVVVLVCCLAGSAQAEKVTSRDFAYGYMIEAEDHGALYSLEVPEAIYQTVRGADLGDIMVFNGAGERVPHALRTMSSVEEQGGKTRSLPLFPLYDRKRDPAESMKLSVRRDTDGTVIAIDNSEQQANDGPLAGYLLDLGEDGDDVGTLVLDWQAEKRKSSMVVRVERSDDLQHWWTVVPKTTLVDLTYGGNRVEQRRIEIPSGTGRYLQLRWPNGEVPVLEEVIGEARPLVVTQKRWFSLYNGQKGKAGTRLAIDFRSGYRVPVRSARLEFYETNSIVSAALQSRADGDGVWRERCRGVFYDLELAGERLVGEPCSFAPTSDLQWRLVVFDDGAGLENSQRNLNLSLGWESDELLFLARGGGPFVLAYGSGRLLGGEHQPSSSEMVLTALGQHSTDIVKRARMGKRIELGGRKALEPPVPPPPWKTWLLWAVLVAGVLGMAMMAASLMKEMQKKGGEDGGDGGGPDR